MFLLPVREEGNFDFNVMTSTCICGCVLFSYIYSRVKHHRIVSSYLFVCFSSMSEMAALWAQTFQKSQEIHNQVNNG